MKILVMHGYSSLNAGDGLLVESTLAVLEEAFGDSIEVTLLASHPDTFEHLRLRTYSSLPGVFGYSSAYLKVLKNIDDFDLIVGVGGGYLRGGNVNELVKTSLVHGIQLFTAGRSKVASVYFPQSIGPFRFGTRRPVSQLLKKIDRIYGRDDRSIAEFPDVPITRIPDLAILSPESPTFSEDLVDDTPILSVRAVNGAVPPLVRELAHHLGTFDGYVQSATRGNDDVDAMSALGPRGNISRNDLLGSGQSRIVVAVRLHAALMALQAGHYVIHLAYERKGIGAFEDLDLSEYVHKVNKFEPERVLLQVRDLASDPSVRSAYVRKVVDARSKSAERRRNLVDELRAIVPARVS